MEDKRFGGSGIFAALKKGLNVALKKRQLMVGTLAYVCVCRYGKNLVPVNRAAEGKVKCPKALELVGFTTRDKIPRW